MDEIIKGKNSSYSRYEELLLRRDNMRKQAFIYQRAYTAEFGDLIIEVFQKKIECIRKKKTIEFCQAAANYGRSVDQNSLQEFLRKEMEEFQKKLERMVDDVKNSKSGRQLTELELRQLKKVYHKLVKLIHPDINPKVLESEELLDLWHRVVIAYECNQLVELEQLEVLVTAALEKAGLGEIDIDIPDIEEKIIELEEEITTIMETDPYMYKYLLDDEGAVEDKKCDLREELKSYEDYSKKLDEILNDLLGNGVNITWRMN